MKTLFQVKDSIRRQIWASGEAENLVSAHDLHFEEGLNKIAEMVEGDEELMAGKLNEVNIIGFCKTTYKCGMTVVDKPPGRILRVYTICNDQWCDPVYYRPVAWPWPEWLGRRAMVYSGAANHGAGAGTSLRLGYSEATATNDATCGRARMGVWAVYRGNIYIAPFIQSTEKVVIEWDGLKTSWNDDDPVNETIAFRNVLKLWMQYAHERDYGSAERAAQFSNPMALRDPQRAGAFDVALAELMWRLREDARAKPNEDWAHNIPGRAWFGSEFDQCLPPADAGPLVVAHIGNYGAQGYGEADVAGLIGAMSASRITGCGCTPSAGYDVAVGQYFHTFISPYSGAYGAQGETNGFFPAPSDADWALNSLQDYLDFFTLPNNERYYDVCLGAIHLFVLDSSASEVDGTAEGNPQAIWLKAKLAMSAAPWKVVVMSDLLDLPFEDWGADMALCSADGSYERLDIGIPVIKNGLGGNQQTGVAVASTGSQFLYQPGQAYGAGRLIATRCSLRYEMVIVDGTNGVLLDSVQLNKRPVGDCAGQPVAGTIDGSTLLTFLPDSDSNQQVFNYAGDPNGHVTAGPLTAVCFDTVNNIVWWRDAGAGGNTGWH